MLDLDRLSIQDLEDLATEVGEEATNNLLEGKIEGAGQFAIMRLTAALHWVTKRHEDPDWTIADSRMMSLNDVTQELTGALDVEEAPKLPLSSNPG